MRKLLSKLRCGVGLALCAGILCAPRFAHAEDAARDEDELAALPPAKVEPLGYDRYRTPIAGGAGYFHTFGSVALGEGLRFNNPYRLSKELGSSAESLSLTASYIDLGLGAVYGRSDGLGHGAVLHLSIADVGIPQEVLSLSYIALERIGNGRPMVFARAGIPLVLQPDVSAGLELGAGGAFMITAGIGVTAELIGDLYYGAGTVDASGQPNHSVSTIPVLSGQLGIFFDYEVLR